MTSLILVLISTVLAADEAGPVLRPEAVESLFVEPDRPATIRWRADRDLPSDSLAYTLRDFQDREVGTGTARAARSAHGCGPTDARPGLLRTRTVGRGDAVRTGGFAAVRPAARGVLLYRQRHVLAGAGRRFAAGTGPHLAAQRDGHVARAAELGRDPTGARTIRLERPQRLRNRPAAACGTASPRAGNVSFGDAVERHGRQVPRGPPRHGGRVAGITRRWRSTWGGLEVWNEPDIFFGDLLPADQYVALVKTLAWAVDREAPGTTLVGGVMAHYHRPFLDTAAECGMLDCVDVASFHTYDRAADAGTGRQVPRLAGGPRPAGHAAVDHGERAALEERAEPAAGGPGRGQRAGHHAQGDRSAGLRRRPLLCLRVSVLRGERE